MAARRQAAGCLIRLLQPTRTTVTPDLASPGRLILPDARAYRNVSVTLGY